MKVPLALFATFLFSLPMPGQSSQLFRPAQEKTQAMQRVLAELQQACGEKYEPQLNPAGDPVCVAKPPAPPEAKK